MNIQQYCIAKKDAFLERRDRKFILMSLLVVVILLLAVLVTRPNFFAARNISSILIQCSGVAIMAAGQIYVMVSGGIDLSIPSVMMLSGCIGALVMKNTGNIWLGIGVIFLVAVVA